MPPNGHALLSASASDRWLHCPPSARLCELYEDKGSDYAAEGTDAHTLCEYKLRKALGMEAVDPTENLTWFNQEMDECANDYVAYILELVEAAKETCSDPVVLIEQRVDFSRWVESGWGTSDAILIADGTMHVIDYKHGLGILVSAVENPQLKCYALGALELFDGIYDIDNVCVHIVQPMFPNVRRHAGGQERPRAVERQHPPQLGGGNIDNVIFHQSDFCPPLFQLCLTFGNGGFFSLVSPVENAQLHIFQDVVWLLPLIEAQEHIAAHEQNQLRIRIALLQLRYGLEGVADAAPVQLDVRNLGLRAVRRGNAQHFEALPWAG